jgi:hypothetical protein
MEEVNTFPSGLVFKFQLHLSKKMVYKEINESLDDLEDDDGLLGPRVSPQQNSTR